MTAHPFIHSDIVAYCERHTSPESEALHHICRQTHLRLVRPQMLSGHWQGQFLSMISQMLHPKRILEIGTFSGYGTLCLATGLSAEGEIHTIEREEEMQDFLSEMFSQQSICSQIYLHIGTAQTIIPHLDGEFDLVFLDADKAHYRENYDLALSKMPAGGVMLIDNVLWYGKVVSPTLLSGDKETENIRAFNQYVQEDSRVTNVLLPLRDGIMMVRKK